MTFSAQHNALVHAARLGDRSAIERLIQACHSDVRRYAYRQCRLGDVDDAVQESLLIVAYKIRSLKAVAAFASWLFQIVRRECHRLERYVFRLDSYDEEQMQNRLACHSDDAIRLDLAKAIESLPEHYREIILLRDFEEMTIKEIAARLQLTPSAVKSRLHRARELVREYLLT